MAREAAGQSRRRRAKLWLPFLLGLSLQHCFVRETRRPVPPQGDPRAWTRKITEANSAGELLSVLDQVVEKSIFNEIHASAAYGALANFQQRRELQQSDAASPVLVKLDRQFLRMLQRKVVAPRTLANVLRAFASLFTEIPAVLKILPGIARELPGKVTGMKPQELSNSLWAAAALKDEGGRCGEGCLEDS